MNAVLIGQHSASHDRREVERLLLSPKPSTLDAFLDDLFRKCIAWHEANVGDLTFAVGVSCDCSVLTPDGMVIVCDDGASGRRQQLPPPARHVVCGTDMVRIGSSETPSGIVNWLYFTPVASAIRPGWVAECTFTFSSDKPLLNV